MNLGLFTRSSRVRYKNIIKGNIIVDNKSTFQNLFQPKSIAVVGASNNTLKPGGRVFKNIMEGGYTGKLWPVNPKDSEILGTKAYSAIDALPWAPDLALIAIPAGGVLDALSALAEKGNRAAIILTAGFGETGEAGKELEKKILQVADQNDMAIIGPNCSGFLTPDYAGKFAGIIPGLESGSVDFVSGSGATVDYLMEQAQVRGVKFSHVINLGNSIQLGVEDMMEMMDENHGVDSAKIILLYLEAVNKPLKLLRHARSLIEKGCIIIGIKSGASNAGARAAASHTGAMATADHTVQALFDKAGIIRVQSKMELIEVTCALISMKKLPTGKRACIVTDAGGPGVMLTDELVQWGVSLPSFSPRTIKKLQELLPPQASLENPIDCLPSRNARQVKSIFEVLGKEEKENLDLAFFITGNSGMSDNREIYDAVKEVKTTCPIPILPVFSSATTCADLLKELVEDGCIYFHDEVAAGQAVGRLVNRPAIKNDDVQLSNYNHDKIKQKFTGQMGALTPEITKDILQAAGFPIPAQEVITEQSDLKLCCQTIGFPVVMKVAGPLHKSDVGGVKVNITNDGEAEQAWQELMSIPDAKGVMIQEMVQGVEVIIGTVRDSGFGQLVMFGLGGIYTEVLKDVSFGLATPETPLSLSEARQMIRNIRSYPILEGVRGERGVCVDTLAEYLVRLGKLVTDFPQINELDLNPVKGQDKALYVVDARILTE